MPTFSTTFCAACVHCGLILLEGDGGITVAVDKIGFLVLVPGHTNMPKSVEQ